WTQGFYEAENKAVIDNLAAWEEATGTKVNLTIMNAADHQANRRHASGRRARSRLLRDRRSLPGATCGVGRPARRCHRCHREPEGRVPSDRAQRFAVL